MNDIELERDSFDTLILHSAGEQETILTVRPFPLTAADGGVSPVGAHSRERYCIERIEAMHAAAPTLLEEELAARDFAPVLHKLLSASSFACPAHSAYAPTAVKPISCSRSRKTSAGWRAGRCRLPARTAFSFQWPMRRRSIGLRAGCLSGFC